MIKVHIKVQFYYDCIYMISSIKIMRTALMWPDDVNYRKEAATPVINNSRPQTSNPLRDSVWWFTGQTELCSSHLRVCSPVSVSVLWGGQVLHQHGRKDAHSTVKLALPEAVVLLVVLVEDADDGSLREWQLVIRLTLVVVHGLDKTHWERRRRKEGY